MNDAGTVRDMRDTHWFRIQDMILDTYAEHIGPMGFALYGILARSANKDHQSRPSLTTLADYFRISRATVVKHLYLLEDYGLIQILHHADARGDADRNSYLLLQPAEQASFLPRQRTKKPGGRKPRGSTGDKLGVVHQVNYGSTGDKLGVVHQVNYGSLPSEQLLGLDLSLDLGLDFSLDPPKAPREENPSRAHMESPNPSVKKKSRSTQASQVQSTAYTPGFLLAWEAYPPVRKQRKVATFALWQARDLEERSVEIAEKLTRLSHTLWAGTEKKFIPMPTTWFNDARYEDELAPLPTAMDLARNISSPLRDHNRSVIEHLRQQGAYDDEPRNVTPGYSTRNDGRSL